MNGSAEDDVESAVLEDEVRISSYVDSHLQEMLAMEKACTSVRGNNLAMQSVPNHMRRRAAAHDTKRLPKRLRMRAHWEHERAGSAPKIPKRPSRKHRRRPKNLREEYQRRSRKHVWLETHIWHAKRFHMAELWGYKVPLHPNDKGIRAAHRANRRFCSIADLSYFCCLELQGPVSEILDGLNHLTSSETGLGFGAKYFIQGNREGNIMLYAKDKYPFNALCDATFLWKPGDDNENGNRTLWLWVHPAAYATILTELKSAFDIQDCNAVSSVPAVDGAYDNSTEKPKDLKEITSQINFVHKRGNFKLKSLKDTLCRFRLSGPLSQAILQEALVPSNLPEPKSGEDPKWWQLYYGDDNNKRILQQQKAAWDTLKGVASPASLPPHMVIGLTVRDPRLFIPQKRTLECADSGTVVEVKADCIPSDVCSSPIWNEDIREEVKSTKITEQAFKALRSSNLVPGSVLELGSEESTIPILLIQHPGKKCSAHHSKGHSGDYQTPGFAAGWDMILPSGWSMAFWIALSYRGARAQGLQELKSTAFDLGLPCFPFHIPDCSASHQMDQARYTQVKGKYDRMPPAKRPNHFKLGVAAPFHYPWKELTTEWTPDSINEDFFVLRSKQGLRSLEKRCSGPPIQENGSTIKKPRKALSQKSVHDLVGIPHQKCLVPVSLCVHLRGHPSEFAMICLPSDDDLAQFQRNKQYGGPLEDIRVEETKEEGKKAKKEKREVKVDDYDLAKLSVYNVVNTSSRKVIGYVTAGSYHLGKGQNAAVGYVALLGLFCLLEMKSHKGLPLVLVRDAHSRQYRFARLSIQAPT